MGYFSTLINKETLKEIASADSRVAFAQENTAGYRMKSCLSYQCINKILFSFLSILKLFHYPISEINAFRRNKYVPRITVFMETDMMSQYHIISI